MNASPTPVSTGSPLLEVSGLSVDFAVDNYWVPAAKKLNYSVESGKALADQVLHALSDEGPLEEARSISLGGDQLVELLNLKHILEHRHARGIPLNPFAEEAP